MLKVGNSLDLKVGDILELSMSIEYLDLPEDVTSFDDADYDTKYDITYCTKDENGKINMLAITDFTVEKGFSADFGNDIEDFIKEDLPTTFEEISDYEIFDVEGKYEDYQTAKIRVKALKE